MTIDIILYHVEGACSSFQNISKCEATEGCQWEVFGYPTDIIIENATATVVNDTCVDVASSVKKNPSILAEAGLASELCDVWCGMNSTAQMEKCKYYPFSLSNDGMENVMGRKLLFGRSAAEFGESGIYYYRNLSMEFNVGELLYSKIRCHMCNYCNSNSAILRASLAPVVKASAEEIQETCVDISRAFLHSNLGGYCEQGEPL